MNATAGFVGIFVRAISAIFWVIQTMVVVWVILSWLLFFAAQTSFRWRNPRLYRVLLQLNEMLDRATSPMLRPFRRLLPAHKMGGIDWSPFILLLTLTVVHELILWGYGLILLH